MNAGDFAFPGSPVASHPLDQSQAFTYPGEQSTRRHGAARARAGTMQFQSPEHERSYQAVCKAVAHARRGAYRAAAGMTTPELRAAARDYSAVVPGPATGEALIQLRMMRTIIVHRTRSPRSRSRAAAQYRSARAGRQS